jgi:hypothetical protein
MLTASDRPLFDWGLKRRRAPETTSLAAAKLGISRSGAHRRRPADLYPADAEARADRAYTVGGPDPADRAPEARPRDLSAP